MALVSSNDTYTLHPQPIFISVALKLYSLFCIAELRREQSLSTFFIFISLPHSTGHKKNRYFVFIAKIHESMKQQFSHWLSLPPFQIDSLEKKYLLPGSLLSPLSEGP
jgi:hypothetical protein